MSKRRADDEEERQRPTKKKRRELLTAMLDDMERDDDDDVHDDDEEGEGEQARRTTPMLRGAPLQIREGSSTIEFPGMPGARGPFRGGAPGDDKYGLPPGIEEDYFPDPNGIIRHRDTFAEHPNQEGMSGFNRIDLALRRKLRDRINSSEDMAFLKALAKRFNKPVAMFYDESDMEDKVRIAALQKLQVAQKLKNIEIGSEPIMKERDMVTREIARLTREMTYITERIEAPARRLLDDAGMATWARLVGRDTTIPGVCAGLLMPYYWRWQYRYVLTEAVDISDPTLPPSTVLFERMVRVMDEDRVLFGTAWLGDIPMVMTKLAVKIATLAGGAASAEWRLAVGIYYIERDVYHRQLRDMVGIVAPDDKQTVPRTRRGEKLQSISMQSQWLSAILLFAGQRAFKALPWGGKENAVASPFIASRADDSDVSIAANGYAWPEAYTVGDNRNDAYPSLTWTTAVANANGSILHKDTEAAPAQREYMPMGELERFFASFGVNPGVYGTVAPASIAGLRTNASTYTQGAFSYQRIYVNRAMPRNPDTYTYLPAGAAAQVTALYTAIAQPEHLLGPFRLNTDISAFTTLFPSLHAYDRVCDILDALVAPALFSFAETYCPTQDKRIPDATKANTEAYTLFGFTLPTQLNKLVGQHAAIDYLGNKDAIADTLPRLEAGTWHELVHLYYPAIERPWANPLDPERQPALVLFAPARDKAAGLKAAAAARILVNMKEKEHYRDVTRFNTTRWFLAAVDGHIVNPNVDKSIVNNAFYRKVLLPGYTHFFREALARFMRPEQGFGAQHLLDIPMPIADTKPAPLRLPFALIEEASRDILPDAASSGAAILETPEEKKRRLLEQDRVVEDVNRSRRAFIGYVAEQRERLYEYLLNTYPADTIFAAAGEPEAALARLNMGPAVGGKWEPVFTTRHADVNYRKALAERFMFWQRDLGTPWPTIALLVDVMGRWVFGRAREQWLLDIAENERSRVALDARIQGTLRFDIRDESLADIQRRETRPTAEYMERAEIAGYLTLSWITEGTLSEGMAFVHEHYGDALTQDELTAIRTNPVLSNAFISLLKYAHTFSSSHNAHARCRYQDVHDSLSHQNQYHSRDEGARDHPNLDKAKRDFFAVANRYLRERALSGMPARTPAPPPTTLAAPFALYSL